MDDAQVESNGQTAGLQYDPEVARMEVQALDILDHMSDALYIVDQHWRIIYVNRRVKELWGQRGDDLLGKNMWEEFPYTVDSHAYQSLLSAMRERGAVEFEYFSAALQRWFDISAYPSGAALVVHFNDITSRKRAEAERERLVTELDESRRLFQRIAETSPDAIFVYDLHTGRVVYINTRSEQVVGYTANEVMELGDRFGVTLWHPDDVPDLMKHWRKLYELADGEVYECEYRLRQPDGTYRWLRTRSSVFARDANGRVQQVIGVTQDITARRRTEESLRESEEHYRSLYDNALDAILLCDDQMRYIDANPAACTLLGYAHDELLHRTLFDITPTLDRERGQEAWQAFLSEGWFEGEYTLVHKDGSTVEAEYRAVANVVPGLHLSILRDVTARKRAEAERRKQQEILQTIFDHIPVMIRFFGVTGRVELVNRAYEETLGWSLDEIQQGNLDILAECYPNPQDYQRVLKRITEATGEWSDVKARVRDGRVIDTTWASVRLPDGRIIGIGQDITARKRAEAERARLFEEVQASREQLQLLSRQLQLAQEAERRAIARELHDEIGQGLTGISLLLTSSQYLPPDQAQARLVNVQALVRDLIDQVRNLALDLRPAMLDDLGLVPALVWLFERYTAQTHVAMRFEHMELEERRFAPEVEITAYRIVQEALTNVARYAGVSEVTVRLWTDADTLWVAIADRGHGFDRASVTQGSDAGRKFGIRGMMERAALAGGQLEIETAPGAGTTVYLQIPFLLIHTGDGGVASDV